MNRTTLKFTYVVAIYIANYAAIELRRYINSVIDFATLKYTAVVSLLKITS